MTNKKINVGDLFLGRCDDLIDTVVDQYIEIKDRKRNNLKDDVIKYIKSKVPYRAQNLELFNTTIDRIYFSLCDMGLTSKEIMSGNCDEKIRNLYADFIFSFDEPSENQNDVNQKKESLFNFISIKQNSIQQEGVPSKVKKETKKKTVSEYVIRILIIAILLELLNTGIKDFSDYKRYEDAKKNMLKIDGYGYHQINTVHDLDFSATLNNIMDTYDEYDMFDNPEYEYLNVYRAYCSVTGKKMYVMDNMIDQIKTKTRSNNSYRDLNKDVKSKLSFLDFMYDRLIEMGFEEVRGKKYVDLLLDYNNIKKNHPYSDPVEYLNDNQKRLLDKVCEKYEELSRKYFIQLGLSLDSTFNVEEFLGSSGRKH